VLYYVLIVYIHVAQFENKILFKPRVMGQTAKVVQLANGGKNVKM
jgi:hypothetical protein